MSNSCLALWRPPSLNLLSSPTKQRVFLTSKPTIPHSLSPTPRSFHLYSTSFLSTPYPLAPSRPRWALPCRLFTWSLVGSSFVVFVMWHTVVGRHDQKQEATLLAAEHRGWMVRHFALSRENLAEGRYHTLLTHAVSHQDFGHLALNMMVLHFVSRAGFEFGIGFPRMSALAIGSVLASASATFLDLATSSRSVLVLGQKQQQSRVTASLGASGMVQGLMVAAALVKPRWPVTLLFIPVPIPFLVATGGFVAWDLWRVVEARRDGIDRRNWTGGITGYAAHLGGAAFGAAFWFVMLRGKGRLMWRGEVGRKRLRS